MKSGVDAETIRCDGQGSGHCQRHSLAAGGEYEQQRPKKIELLLDRETPEMEQRLGIGRDVEIATLVPQQEIRDEHPSSKKVLAERLVFARYQQNPPGDSTRREHREQGGENAPRAPHVEVDKREIAGLELRQDDCRDQESGDDKEDIDTDEAARNKSRERMKADHRHDG